MSKTTISGGLAHKMPDDLTKVLTKTSEITGLWEAITPIARNEFICWVEDAKKIETRQRRIDRVQNDLTCGKRRPCCWAGCTHR